jgi:urease alpha subunit
LGRASPTSASPAAGWSASSTSPELLEAVLAGCGGFKIHEDWGATPQDQGAITIINSDALGMSRIGETARHIWQLTDVQPPWPAKPGRR